MRFLLFALLAAGLAIGVASAHASSAVTPTTGDPNTLLVVPHGQPIQIAFADSLTGSTSSYAASLADAVDMAVEAHPKIHGFPIQVNLVDAPCGDAAADVAAAKTIVANRQNAAVLGQVCSNGFEQALPVYEADGLVTISGSATNDALPSYGPTVFNRTVVDDDGFDAWYAAVSTLPSDVAWQQAYALEFGSSPMPFADLYYDAAGLLLRDLGNVARVNARGDLVLVRPLLARAVRHTTGYPGVTCTVTIDPASGNRVDDPAALSRCRG